MKKKTVAVIYWILLLSSVRTLLSAFIILCKLRLHLITSHFHLLHVFICKLPLEIQKPTKNGKSRLIWLCHGFNKVSSRDFEDDQRIVFRDESFVCLYVNECSS